MNYSYKKTPLNQGRKRRKISQLHLDFALNAATSFITMPESIPNANNAKNSKASLGDILISDKAICFIRIIFAILNTQFKTKHKNDATAQRQDFFKTALAAKMTVRAIISH